MYVMWYGTPPYCDVPVLHIEINNQMKYKFINIFFPKIGNLIPNSIAQWVKVLTVNL